MYEMNPWWETGEIPREFLPPEKRTLFRELERSLDQRFIDIIVGLRRTGKTTLMFQLIDRLLEQGVDPRTLLYFTFDERSMDLREIIREYEERVLRAKLMEKPAYIFLDEVHKLLGWPEKLKLVYDLNPKVKLVVSGSASLNVMRGARESLAGRCVFHRLDPLSFAEYLRLRGERVPPPEDFEIFEHRLAISLKGFLLRGFPEVISAGDREAQRYVKELVLERILYRDIPESFAADDTELLRLLAEHVCSSPGTILNIDSLSKDFGRARKTIRDYLGYLELTFLIRRVSNLRGSKLATSRKNRKGYPYHPTLCTTQDESRIAETLVMNEASVDHYWRLRNFEVDFVLKDGGPLPIEVKYKRKVDERDLRGIQAFCKRFGLKRGIVVTKETMAGRGGLELIPLLWFTLYKERLTRPGVPHA
jgi:predicted AAA+ superfamily ATPase